METAPDFDPSSSMQRLSNAHRGSIGIASRRTRHGHRNPGTSDHLLATALRTPPLVLLSFVVLLMAYCLTSNERHFSQKRMEQQLESMGKAGDSSIPPSLLELADLVCDALDAHGVTYWLMPGAGLLPGRRVAPWREGLDFAVNQSDVMRVLLAQSELLQPRGVVAIESYFGLRLFPLSGYADDRYDFRTPFIDLMYFQQKPSSDPNHVVNYCCDCDPVSMGVCTKKACNCLVCALHIDRLFPLFYGFHIQGMRRPISVPKDHENLDMILNSQVTDAHPALFVSIPAGDTH